MIFRPRKDMHFSRRAMGFLFLACGLLLLTVHYLAGIPFLAFAAIFLYYAPRWDLRIDVGDETLEFSENVLDERAVRLAWGDLSEIRRVAESREKGGFPLGQPDWMGFVEFETRAGKVWRMHDIFPDGLDEELLRRAAERGVQVQDFRN